MSASGHPVLLLHGQPGGAADWRAVVDRLGAAADPIAIDRPGWDGRSRARDLAGNGSAALAAMDARGARSAVVVGHSLGAAIAAWLAVRHPDRVTSLVLCAPAANLAALYPVDRWLAAPVAGELTGVATMGALGLALSVGPLRRRISATSGIGADYLQEARRTLLSPAGWRAYADEQRILIRDLPELESGLGTIRAPTTILTGTDDRIVPSDAPRRLATQIPGARLITRHRVGHLLPQRYPDFVSDAILAALDHWPASTLDRG